MKGLVTFMKASMNGKKVVSLVLTLSMVVSMFACMSGLGVYAIDGNAGENSIGGGFAEPIGIGGKASNEETPEPTRGANIVNKYDVADGGAYPENDYPVWHCECGNIWIANADSIATAPDEGMAAADYSGEKHYLYGEGKCKCEDGVGCDGSLHKWTALSTLKDYTTSKTNKSLKAIFSDGTHFNTYKAGGYFYLDCNMGLPTVTFSAGVQFHLDLNGFYAVTSGLKTADKNSGKTETFNNGRFFTMPESTSSNKTRITLSDNKGTGIMYGGYADGNNNKNCGGIAGYGSDSPEYTTLVIYGGEYRAKTVAGGQRFATFGSVVAITGTGSQFVMFDGTLVGGQTSLCQSTANKTTGFVSYSGSLSGGTLYVGKSLKIYGGTVYGGLIKDTKNTSKPGYTVSYTQSDTEGTVEGKDGKMYIKTESAATACGGAIYVAGGSEHIIKNAKIIGGNTAKNGGSICVYSESASITIENSEIIADSSTLLANGGSALYSIGKTTIKKSTIKGSKINPAKNGGTIYLSKSGNTVITDSIIEAPDGDDVALNGAAIYATSVDLNIDNSKVTGGKLAAPESEATWQGNGGAVYIDAIATATFENCELSGGTASGDGGCIYTSGSLIVENSTITGGTAGGSGGNIHAAKGAVLNITGSTVTGGKTTATSKYGGNIYLTNATANITDSTVSYGQTKDIGGNIYSTGSSETAQINLLGETKVLNGKTTGTGKAGGNIYCGDGTLLVDENVIITGGTGTVGGRPNDDVACNGSGKITVKGTVDYINWRWSKSNGTVPNEASFLNITGNAKIKAIYVEPLRFVDFTDFNAPQEEKIDMTLFANGLNADVEYKFAGRPLATGLSDYSFINLTNTGCSLDAEGKLAVEHVHNWDTEWTADELNGHYHKCLSTEAIACDAVIKTAEGAAYAEHDWAKEDGVCTVCSFVCTHDGQTGICEHCGSTVGATKQMCECGDQLEGHSCQEEIWTEWSNQAILPTSGNWYLTANVDLTDEVVATNTLKIDLNGHSITQTETGKRVFNIAGEISFVLTDSVGGGVVTGGNVADNGGNIYLGNNASFKFYAGKISDGEAESGGNLYMESGSLDVFKKAAFEGGTAQKGGSIYIVSGNATFTDCTVSGGSAQTGGNIYTAPADNIYTTCVICRGATFKEGVVEGDDGDGGNMYLGTKTVTKFYDCTITDGISGKNGANMALRGFVVMVNTQVINPNSKTSNHGPNIHANAGDVILVNSTLDGGVWLQPYGDGNYWAILGNTVITEGPQDHEGLYIGVGNETHTNYAEVYFNKAAAQAAFEKYPNTIPSDAFDGINCDALGEDASLFVKVASTTAYDSPLDRVWGYGLDKDRAVQFTVVNEGYRLSVSDDGECHIMQSASIDTIMNDIIGENDQINVNITTMNTIRGLSVEEIEILETELKKSGSTLSFGNLKAEADEYNKMISVNTVVRKKADETNRLILIAAIDRPEDLNYEKIGFQLIVEGKTYKIEAKKAVKSLSYNGVSLASLAEGNDAEINRDEVGSKAEYFFYAIIDNPENHETLKTTKNSTITFKAFIELNGGRVYSDEVVKAVSDLIGSEEA